MSGLLVVALGGFFVVLAGQPPHPRIRMFRRQVLDVAVVPIPDKTEEQIQPIHPVLGGRIAVSFRLVRVFTEGKQPLRHLAAELTVRDLLLRVEIVFRVLGHEDDAVNFVLVAVRHRSSPLQLEPSTSDQQRLNFFAHMPACSPESHDSAGVPTFHPGTRPFIPVMGEPTEKG